MPIEEAKKILEEYSLKITNCGPESFAIATLQEYVRKLEKEQEPKQGRWIGQNEGAYYPIECSRCHKEAFVDDFGYRTSAYCPNCGAKMNSEDKKNKNE